MKKINRIVSVLFLLGVPAFANINPATEQAYLAAGGSAKALQHLKCILARGPGRRYPLKSSTQEGMGDRCNRDQSGNTSVNVRNTEIAAIVDFTKPSNQRRMYMIPLGETNEAVQRYFVSHGRFGNTSHTNTSEGKDKNTVLWARYFSNQLGSNASSTGLYITGVDYLGNFQGPDNDDPKSALVLYGVEPGVNDNACDRAVVIHGYQDVREGGSKPGMHYMSSGCFMLDYAHINQILARLNRGDRSGGTAYFAYGPREAALPDNHYCQGKDSPAQQD